MMLPPKALNALADLKKELLSAAQSISATQNPEPIHLQRQKEKIRPQTMRHARVRCRAFQRMCQRRAW